MWEWRNQTTTAMMAILGGGEVEPVAIITTDSGQAFGPMLKLATNGALGGEAG